MFSSDQELADQRLENLEGRAMSVQGSVFENCVFVRCNFSGSSLKRCRFVECGFEHCDLSNLQVHGTAFRGASFHHCKLIGINWANTNGFDHVTFESCVLNLATFSGLDLKKAVLRDCVAREADFADTNLTEADCRRTDFAGARFSKTNLTKADLRGALSYAIRPDDNRLKKAKFSLPEATLLLYGLDIELEE